MEVCIDLAAWCQWSVNRGRLEWEEWGGEGVKRMRGEKGGLSESVGIGYLGDAFREKPWDGL